MQARYLNAPLLLLLWQVAPNLARDGRVRLSLGAGMGQYSYEDPGSPAGVDCYGQRYDAVPPRLEKKRVWSGAGSAEFWIARNVRVHSALGAATNLASLSSRTTGAAQVVLELDKLGAGLGLGGSNEPGRSIFPSASLRVGSLDGLSMRADYYQPNTTIAMIGGPRLAMAYAQPKRRGLQVLFGIASTPDSDHHLGGFVEAAVPLGFLHGGLLVNGFNSQDRSGQVTTNFYTVGLGVWVQP